MNSKKRSMLFFATTALFMLAANFAHAVTPTFFQSLGLGNYMFGVALATMLAVNFCVSPFWGKLNDYVSSRVSLLICSIGYGVGQMFFGLSKTEAHVIIARGFTGLFTAGAFVSMMTYIVNTTKDEKQRGTNLAIYATIQSICNAFGYLIGGLLGEISIQAAIRAQYITLAICGILYYFICEKDAKIEDSNIKITEVLKKSNPLSAFAASKHFMTITLSILFAIVAFQSMGNTAFDQSFNYFLRDRFGFSSGYNGIIKGIMGLITLVVNSTLTMWIMRKTNINKSITLIFMGSSVTMALAIAFSANPVPYIIFNVFYFAFTAVTFPLLQNMVAKSATGENSNLVIGFYNAIRSLGSVIGALVAGVLYNVSAIYPFVFGFIVFIGAGLFSWVYSKRDVAEQ